MIRIQEWGWRFIGADIQASNGMLIECYGEWDSIDFTRTLALN